MKKTAILLMIIAILSKILGFGRDVTLSFFYGASNISDAYLIALTIPSVIFGFISAGISTGFIPMYSNVQESYGEEGANCYKNNLINVLLLFCTLLVAAGLLFTEPIVRVFAVGFEADTFALAIRFTKISLIGIYFAGIVSIFNGFLQIKGNYVIPAMIGFPLNIVTIISIIISAKTDVVVLAIGSVIAVFAQLTLLIPFAKKKGYKYQLFVNLKDEHLKRMVYIALPIIVGASVNQINILVDRTLASGIAVGGISALNYAAVVNEFALGLFVAPISAVMYPMISKMAAKDNKTGLKDTITEVINLVNLLVIPATVGLIIFAGPVIRLLFERGAFDEQGVVMTAGALSFYAAGIIGFGLRDILSKGFYAIQDTKTPAVNAAVAVVLNIILNIVLSKYMGLNGLALATSISATFCTGLLLISFRKRLGHFGMRNVMVSGVKILLISLVMGVIAKLSYSILTTHLGSNLALLVAIAIGIMVYFLMIYFAKIKEVDNLVETVRNRLMVNN